MAWNDVASNQMVSYLDASTSGFTLLTGQSHLTTLPAANQCMDKTAMQTKYNLLASNLTSYASNQLVPKSAWASAATGPLFISGGTSGIYTGNTGYMQVPSSVLSGDFLIMLVQVQGSTMPTTPSGWSVISSSYGGGAITILYYKFANGTESGATINVTATGASYVLGTVNQYRNVNATTPYTTSQVGQLNAGPGVAGISNVSILKASNFANSLAVTFFAAVNNASTVSSVVPGAWTVIQTASWAVGLGHTISIAYQLLPTVGTNGGNMSINFSTGTYVVVWEFVLNPV